MILYFLLSDSARVCAPFRHSGREGSGGTLADAKLEGLPVCWGPKEG